MIDGQLLQKIASFIFNILVSNQYSARVLPGDNCLIVPDGWPVNGIWVFVGLLGPMYHLSASPPELTIHSIHYCIEGNFHLAWYISEYSIRKSIMQILFTNSVKYEFCWNILDSYWCAVTYTYLKRSIMKKDEALRSFKKTPRASILQDLKLSRAGLTSIK